MSWRAMRSSPRLGHVYFPALTSFVLGHHKLCENVNWIRMASMQCHGIPGLRTDADMTAISIGVHKRA